MTTTPQTTALRSTDSTVTTGAATTSYAFGPFVADARTHLLRRDGVVVPLSPKTFEVLLTLLRGRGQVVTKDELFKAVWPDTVVEENNLARHISTLRKTLEEKLDEHRFIVTVPGRGYRFVAPVREMEADELSSSPPAAPPPAHETAEATPVVPFEPPARTPRDAIVDTVRPRTRVSPWGLALGGTLAIVAVAAIWWLKTAGPQPAAGPTVRSLWQVTFDEGLKSDPTFSPDGHLVAYAADKGDNADIWVRPAMGEGDALRLTSSPAHDWQPSWSPDGRTIAFRSERGAGGIYLMSATGGEERQLTDFGYEPHWSPDGRSLLFYNTALQNIAERPRIYIVGLDARPPREIAAPGAAAFRPLRAAWHPDGRVSLLGVRKGGVRTLVTLDKDGGAPVFSEATPAVQRRVAEAGLVLADFVWSPSGDSLYFEAAANGIVNLWRIDVDPRTLAWVGGPERLTTGAGRDVGLSVSADGQRLAFSIRTERTRIWELPLDQVSGLVTGAGVPISAPESDASFPDALPDGARVIYRMARPGEDGLWARTADGTTTLVVAAGKGEFVGYPRQSADGSVFTYLRGQTGRARQFPAPWAAMAAGDQAYELVVREADGSERVLPRHADTSFLVTDFLGTSEVIGACRGSGEARFSICRRSLDAVDGASASQVLASKEGHNLFGARLSPNGRWISLTAIDLDEPSQAAVYVMPSGGGPLVRVTTNPSFNDKVRWAADGRSLYFVSSRAGLFNVWRKAFDPETGRAAGAEVQVTHFERPGLTVLQSLAEMALGLTSSSLYLPLTESTGQVWVLGNLGHLGH